MKKLFVAALALVVMNANAQTEKGSLMVGGGLNLRTAKSNSEFTVNPNVGYFLANNFALGGNVNMSFLKQGSLKTNVIGVGPFARYYVGTTNTKPFFATEINYLHNVTKSTVSGMETKTKNDGYGFLFGMGFAAFVNETVAIEGLAGYNYSKFSGIDGNSGFALRIGFQLYFNKTNTQQLKANVLGQ